MNVMDALKTDHFFKCPSSEACLKGAKATALALAALGLAYQSPLLTAVAVGGAIAYRYYPRKQPQAVLDIPPFEQIQFQRPWEEVYLPLYRQLPLRGDDWSKQVSDLLKSHDIWFESGQFQVAKKDGKRRNEIETFYALLSLAYGCQADYGQMKAIYRLLIRPFMSRVSKEVIQQVYWPFQVALFRSANRTELDDEKAAIHIQRTYRYSQYIKSEKTEDPLIPWDSYSVRLNPNPPIPKQSNAIVKEAAKKWIQAHTKQIRPTAQKFISCIRHVSFEKFKQRLRIGVQSFHNHLMGLPADQQKFVIVIPDARIDSSNKWVTELALPFFKKLPVDVILASQFQVFKERHPEVKRAVLLDDAAYSGKQLSRQIDFLRGDGYSFCAIVPYMTYRGGCLIANPDVWISERERMLSVQDLCRIGTFDSQEERLLKSITSDYDQGDLDCRTLTYFDHKIADDLSTYRNILEKGSLLTKSTLPVCFIPQTQPPYKTP